MGSERKTGGCAIGLEQNFIIVLARVYYVWQDFILLLQTKSRTITNVNIDATDEHVYGFAEAMLLLQNHGASISRIDAEILTA
ncbi:DUF1659 domain-containing protein [Proteocatella sphenisci]